MLTRAEVEAIRADHHRWAQTDSPTMDRLCDTALSLWDGPFQLARKIDELNEQVRTQGNEIRALTEERDRLREALREKDIKNMEILADWLSDEVAIPASEGRLMDRVVRLRETARKARAALEADK